VAPAMLLALALGGATYVGVRTMTARPRRFTAAPAGGLAATAVFSLGPVVVGCGLIAWSRQLALGAVVLAGLAIGVVGLLAILSFGVLALVVAAGLLGWACSGRWSGACRGRAAAGAVLAGGALPVLVVVGMAGPLVDCDVNGVTSGENVILGLGSGGGDDVSSASAASSASWTFSGRAEGPGYDYSYVCRDARCE
jgi:hypothetical protein